jgi:hypothetical protein
MPRARHESGKLQKIPAANRFFKPFPLQSLLFAGFGELQSLGPLPIVLNS